MDQPTHAAWNASHYPGTRQLCAECGEPTGRCEDDSLYNEYEQGPLCECCYNGLSFMPVHCDGCGKDIVNIDGCPNCGTARYITYDSNQ